MNNDERAAWLRLTLTPGVGPVTARKLLSAFGLPTAIFTASSYTLASQIGSELARRVAAAPSEEVLAAIEKTERWLQQDARHSLLTLADADYPTGLLSLADAPVLLYAVGQRQWLSQPMIALVGARSATQQGSANAEAFAQALARAGLCIVSGLALGIDAAAHRGALQALEQGAGASTVALVGTGIDVIYPSSNRALTERVREQGLVLSEYPLGTAAIAHNFPRRNRLIAALAQGVLVVEAALRSGSLITARLAAELGRDVFAIPGSIHSPLAKGCHRLIKEGAKLVESAADVLEELRLVSAIKGEGIANPSTGVLVKTLAASVAPMSELQAKVLQALGHDPVDIDLLCTRTGCAAGELSAVLLELELAQQVERLPGNRYQKLV